MRDERQPAAGSEKQAQEGEFRADEDSLQSNASEAALARNNLPVSLIDCATREAAVVEEQYWQRLKELENVESTLDARVERKEVYKGLAIHYASLGGQESAAQFLKNAIEQVDEPELRHALARLQGMTGDYDFIINYIDILKGRPYDLKLALEFCFFLERQNFHDAAINHLELELQKRPKQLNPPNDLDAEAISKFFQLVQTDISIERQVRIKEYQELFANHFPKEMMDGLTPVKEVFKETIEGIELVEIDRNFTMTDEVIRARKFLTFFISNYTMQFSIVVTAVMLLSLSIARVDNNVIANAGTLSCMLLSAFTVFELIRSFRLSSTSRLRVHTKVAQNAAIASFAMMMLNWLAPVVLGRGSRFFSVVEIKIMSVVLVAAIIWRTYLSLASIHQIIVDIKEDVMHALTRRMLRRQISSLVSGTSQLAILLGWVPILGVISRGTARLSLFAALQALFLLLCWRWGYLESRAEKQKLRESLVFFIAITFMGLVAIEYLEKANILEFAFFLSLDGVMLLGVMLAFALQITSVSRRVWYFMASLFAILNFAPTLVIIDTLGNLASFMNEDFVSFSRIVEAILVVTFLLVVQKKRQPVTQFVHQETYMEAKYKITGGQQGGVGDRVDVRDFVQIWQANEAQIDLATLATELASLRQTLASQAKEASHFEALGAVARTEDAANAGNGPVALEHLKKAGNWFWDAATKVGIGVVTGAAKEAIGIKS